MHYRYIQTFPHPASKTQYSEWQDKCIFYAMLDSQTIVVIQSIQELFISHIVAFFKGAKRQELQKVFSLLVQSCLPFFGGPSWLNKNWLEYITWQKMGTEQRGISHFWLTCEVIQVNRVKVIITTKNGFKYWKLCWASQCIVFCVVHMLYQWVKFNFLNTMLNKVLPRDLKTSLITVFCN